MNLNKITTLMFTLILCSTHSNKGMITCSLDDFLNTEKTVRLLDSELSLNTKLYSAIVDNDLKKVKEALQNGADIEETFFEGSTPLILATIKNYAEIVNYLLEAGAIASAQNISGDTSLDIAKQKGYTKLVKILEDWPKKVQAKVEEAGFGIPHTDISKIIAEYAASPELSSEYKILNILNRIPKFAKEEFYGTISLQPEYSYSPTRT